MLFWEAARVVVAGSLCEALFVASDFSSERLAVADCAPEIWPPTRLSCRACG